MSRSTAHSERNKALREGFADIPAAKAASPPTRDIIAAECQRQGVALKTEDVPDSQGARIHWVGEGGGEDVLLYFHGGGFGMSAFPGHVMFLIETQQKMKVQGKELAIAVLEHGLTPTLKFPVQHTQAILALKHILRSSSRKASNVIIAGDSAGGNLALGVLSATTHTHASIPSLHLEGNLKGALLISPWTSFSSAAQSYTANAENDIVTEDTMITFRDDFIPKDFKNEYAEPALADPDWWRGVMVDKVLVLGGEYEIFWDYIDDLGKKMKEAGVDVESVKCELQVHIDCILDAQSGLEVGRMSREGWGWLGSVLS